MKRILIQLDPDPQASAFDAVVAIDSDVDHLVQHSGVKPEDVESLVHGAIFTRGPKDLKNTAIFVGGTDVLAGEQIMERVQQTFFGPMRVSVMLDANGANTTAAAAIHAAKSHLDLSKIEALVLGGTGPVGQRAARLLLGQGATVRLASRNQSKAAAAGEAIVRRMTGSGHNKRLTACQVDSPDALRQALDGIQLVISAGAAGVQLLPRKIRESANALKVAIDLNAVPPVGIEGVEVMDNGDETGKQIVYGAIGIGGTKMKIHKAAIRQLFRDNQQVLDAESIFGCKV